MHADYRIREATNEDLGVLADIERAAAAIFRDVGIDGAFLDEATSLDAFSAACADGRLWVALCRGRCVGFAIAGRLDGGEAWLDEIDVHPDHARRGVGRALVATVIAWARRTGCASVGLTTFRDVAWNAPFYARLGFREVPAEEHSEEICGILAGERERDLPMERRLVMRLELAKEASQP